MQNCSVAIGDKVIFNSKVFSPPYTPHYDSYAGKIFMVVAIHEGNHIELRCITDPSFTMKGCPHDDELEVVQIMV